jgi:hypothetical protein
MMNEETNRFDELLSRYLDGELSQGERGELLQLLAAPESAERFLETTKLNAEITGLLSAPVPDNVMVELVMSDLRKNDVDVQQPLRLRTQSAQPAPSITPVDFAGPAPKPRTRPRFTALKWAAVLVGVIAVAAVFFSGFWRSSDFAKVVGVQGEVFFISGSVQKPPEVNSTLGVGKLKTVGPSSRVTMVFNDGTRVDLDGGTVLDLRPSKDNARVLLENGSLKSEIRKQAKNRSFVFSTPEAEAIVVGTKLRLAVSGHSTRLEVFEGEVQFRRIHDSAEVRVRAGEFAVVAPNVPFVATPHHPILTTHESNSVKTNDTIK